MFFFFRFQVVRAIMVIHSYGERLRIEVIVNSDELGGSLWG